MELFSEIYGCYYQIVSDILSKTDKNIISKQDMLYICDEKGFAESSLSILPKLCSGEWNFIEKTGSDSYTSRLSHAPYMPATLLQKRWLKALLSDARIQLFFNDEALSELQKALSDVEPLFHPDYFYYYDRFDNGDDFTSADYQQNFRLIMRAIKDRRVIAFNYHSSKGKRSHKAALPLRLEYSAKNNRFRLIALKYPTGKRTIIERYNLCGIEQSSLTDILLNDVSEDALETFIHQSYDAEPVHMLIKNERNALERAMLHFANYEKDTIQLDENTWECIIYYSSSMETELLIEILSFGPTVKVIAPDAFLSLVKERLQKQLRLLQSFQAADTVTEVPDRDS